jgi:hypothetical protein
MGASRNPGRRWTVMDVVVYSLREASDIRRRQVEAAKAEFETTLAKAAAKAAMRTRSAGKQWETARFQARRVAHVRVALWRRYQDLPDGEILNEIRRHEQRLTPAYLAEVPLTRTAQDAERWYVRLLRREILLRAAQPWTCRVPGCRHGHRVPVTVEDVA